MMLNKRSVSTLAFMVIWTVFTILALTWGIMFDLPDFIHVNYGFPLVWATHTLSTIAGPVDIWQVNVSNLFIDLLVWLGTMVAIAAVTLHTLDRKN
ncbi:MAG: hypothetical protein NWF14_08375 [Candidatus Bathyarchaeota archaeon]|nr:hypothetical protein [Candidatus Bathyarchaeota archaeon]